MRHGLDALVLGLLAAGGGVFLATSSGCGDRPRPRNAVLVVLDTARADRLSLYGGPRPTTPVLERLAREGVVFEQAVTNATWTLPAVSGLLSGRYPSGAVFKRGLRVSLVEDLRAAGWATAAITEGGYVSRAYGIDRGFQTFREHAHGIVPVGSSTEADTPQDEHGPQDPQADLPPIEPGREIERTFEQAGQWLADHGRDGPFFLMVHTYEPHAPYLRNTFTAGMDRGGLPESFKVVTAAVIRSGAFTLSDAAIAYIQALYDGGLAEADRYLGQLLDTLDELGLADDTLIVVTSDHGEDLAERDPPWPGSHGYALYDELSLVPLILYDPTRRYPSNRIRTQVRTIDTMHTVLDLLGVPVPGKAGGRSLLPVMLGDEIVDRPAFMRLRRDPKGTRREMYGLRAGGRKLIVEVKDPDTGLGGGLSFFDLVKDPRELDDRGLESSPRVARMRNQLRHIRRAVDFEGLPDFRATLDAPDSLSDQLRALGYVE
jgi:arylsulfatase A-like enzyme